MINPSTLIGQTFNRLTIIGIADKKLSDGSKYFICECSCGKKNLIKKAQSVTQNKTKSCGCLAIEKAKKTHRLNPGDTTFNMLEQRYRRAAKERKQMYSLTREQFRSLISSNCHYCGFQGRNINGLLSKNGNIKGNRSTCTKEWADRQWIKANGIDRKDNSIGYELDNCLPCCEICNIGKNNRSYNDFINYINRLTLFNTKEK